MLFLIVYRAVLHVKGKAVAAYTIFFLYHTYQQGAALLSQSHKQAEQRDRSALQLLDSSSVARLTNFCTACLQVAQDDWQYWHAICTQAPSAKEYIVCHSAVQFRLVAPGPSSSPLRHLKVSSPPGRANVLSSVASAFACSLKAAMPFSASALCLSCSCTSITFCRLDLWCLLDFKSNSAHYGTLT
jgi:hypothetical protein